MELDKEAKDSHINSMAGSLKIEDLPVAIRDLKLLTDASAMGMVQTRDGIDQASRSFFAQFDRMMEDVRVKGDQASINTIQQIRLRMHNMLTGKLNDGRSHPLIDDASGAMHSYSRELTNKGVDHTREAKLALASAVFFTSGIAGTEGGGFDLMDRNQKVFIEACF